MPGMLDKVLIIESVGADDLFDRRSEGEGLQRMLHLSGVRSALRGVRGKADFIEELKVFGSSDADVLHLSCHGNDSGIGFTNGEIMPWSEFYAHSDRCLDNKILAMSSCGAMGTSVLSGLYCAGDYRPKLIVGSPDSITWDDAFVSWGLFYGTLVFESRVGVVTPYTHLKRTLASIALARGCEFTASLYLEDDHKYADRTASQCLAAICSGELEYFQLDNKGGDIEVPQKVD